MNPNPTGTLQPIEVLGDGPIPDPSPRDSWVVLGKHGNCFVCQPDNPGGLRADLFRDGEVIRCPFTFSQPQEGPPRHAHGGSIAALMDEIMGAAAWSRRHNLLAVHLELDYRRPIPLNTELMALGWVRSEGNRSIKVAGEIRLPDGTTAVQALGVFAIAPDMFQNPFFG